MSCALVIPAGGSGTRLGSSEPKALTRVAGRPMLDWLLDRYLGSVQRVVVVSSPRAEDGIRALLRHRCVSHEVVVQPNPTGMLDAIRLAEIPLRSPERPRWVWITWCDQVAIRAETVRRLADECSAAAGITAVVIPTVERDVPYVHLERDASGRVARILRSREGDVMPSRGENDLGLFALSREAYFDWLPEFDREFLSDSAGRERDFLPFLAWLRGRAEIKTFPAQDAFESVGINTPAELKRVERWLLHA